MIHVNAIRHIIDPTDKTKERKPFDMVFVKLSSGERIRTKAVCTSSSFERDLFTFRIVSSGQTRSIHFLQIVKFNGEEVLV